MFAIIFLLSTLVVYTNCKIEDPGTIYKCRFFMLTTVDFCDINCKQWIITGIITSMSFVAFWEVHFKHTLVVHAVIFLCWTHMAKSKQRPPFWFLFTLDEITIYRLKKIIFCFASARLASNDISYKMVNELCILLLH